MQRVKQFIAAGVSIPTAIKESLGTGLQQFADKYDLPRPTLSDAINGGRRPTDEVIAALVTELGGTPDEWRELLWLAAKPETATSGEAA